MFARLSPRERIALVAGIAALVLLTGERLVLRPLMSMFREIGEETTATEKLLVRNHRTLAQKESVTKEYEKYVKYTQNSSSDDEEIAELLSSIEERADRLGLKMNRMEPRTIAEADFYKEYAVDIDMDCKIDTLIKFLHESYSSSKLIRVSEMSITPTERDSDTAKAVMIVTRISVRGLPKSQTPPLDVSEL